MEKIRIQFDPSDNSLQVWFDEPRHMAYLSPIEAETPGDFHLIKNDAGHVIGLELQFYHLRPGSLPIEFETMPLLNEREIIG